MSSDAPAIVFCLSIIVVGLVVYTVLWKIGKTFRDLKLPRSDDERWRCGTLSFTHTADGRTVYVDGFEKKIVIDGQPVFLRNKIIVDLYYGEIRRMRYGRMKSQAEKFWRQQNNRTGL